VHSFTHTHTHSHTRTWREDGLADFSRRELGESSQPGVLGGLVLRAQYQHAAVLARVQLEAELAVALAVAVAVALEHLHAPQTQRALQREALAVLLVVAQLAGGLVQHEVARGPGPDERHGLAAPLLGQVSFHERVK
jgi:hypothetical protein